MSLILILPSERTLWECLQLSGAGCLEARHEQECDKKFIEARHEQEREPYEQLANPTNTKSSGELANALTRRVHLLEARTQNLERALRSIASWKPRTDFVQTTGTSLALDAVIEIAEDALQGWVFYDER